jgi:two-component system, OmpR family, sensor kinase
VLLNNLVENALRYTPAGGVVDVVAAVSAGHPTLCVVDTGPGIPETEHAKVFGRFYRGPQAAEQAADAGGSGLGLAIVKAIADLHGATVSLHRPSKGRGLEVRLVFAQPPV